MVERQIVARGIANPSVLAAMRTVPRELFVPAELADEAYDDSPLPIEERQTISQPYIVALMTDALELSPRDRVLEIGAGSGYAAAVLSRVAGEVVTIERHAVLAEAARSRIASLGYSNVRVIHRDGTLGAPELAPYDAIVVTAGGPSVPAPLLAQLRVGGRLVIPIGATPRTQRLLRVTRTSTEGFDHEDLGAVVFVPLIGVHGWQSGDGAPHRAGGSRAGSVAKLIRAAAEPIDAIESVELGPLLDRIGSARVVLLGEATHGTSEFYRMRARITRELVMRRGFQAVAVEADWPDAARIDRHVRHRPTVSEERYAFARFPSWMWRNEETAELVAWLREYNRTQREPSKRVGFYGLDLYSLGASIDAVVRYLSTVDPPAALAARARYARLSGWRTDLAAYGRSAGHVHTSIDDDLVSILRDLFAKRVEYAERDGDRFFDAAQNARLVANAELYYRTMHLGSVSSWNLRDKHMFETLEALMRYLDGGAKVVVWAHNSHVGDARATDMGQRGEHNIGQLVRQRFGDGAYTIGFGTDQGTVAAASEWDAPMEIMRLRPSHAESYGQVFHAADVPAMLLPLRRAVSDALTAELGVPRLERAIGVIYRPDDELRSHYFESVLTDEFDEYVWFDESSAVTPLARGRTQEFPGQNEGRTFAAGHEGGHSRP